MLMRSDDPPGTRRWRRWTRSPLVSASPKRRRVTPLGSPAASINFTVRDERRPRYVMKTIGVVVHDVADDQDDAVS
jgi:hypothetical protein